MQNLSVKSKALFIGRRAAGVNVGVLHECFCFRDPGDSHAKTFVILTLFSNKLQVMNESQARPFPRYENFTSTKTGGLHASRKNFL